jgi:hypothetical protein
VTAPSLRGLNRSLSAGRRLALDREDALAAALEAVLAKAGRTAARSLRERAVLTAAANGHGRPPWEPPHPDELVDLDALASALRARSRPARLAAARDVMADSLDGVGLDFDVKNPFTGAAIAGAGKHVRAIAETTRIGVMRAVRESCQQGLSVEDAAKAITLATGAAGPTRARLIASTELAAVANGSALAATQIVAQATGGGYSKRWLTAPGADYPRHEDYEGLDGQIVALNEAFDVGGDALQFPGDPDGPPHAVCRCRCTLLFVGSPSAKLERSG